MVQLNISYGIFWIGWLSTYISNFMLSSFVVVEKSHFQDRWWGGFGGAAGYCLMTSDTRLYIRSRRLRKERRKLVRELQKEGITWQAQAERRWLAGILANEKAVAPLLGFLKATGGRERMSEREGYRMRAKKRPSWRRSAWIDSGGDYPKVVVTHSGKAKQRWTNKWHKPG